MSTAATAQLRKAQAAVERWADSVKRYGDLLELARQDGNADRIAELDSK